MIRTFEPGSSPRRGGLGFGAATPEIHWAKFGKAKGGFEAHVLLDHDDYRPGFLFITDAKRSDVKMADAFALNAGSIMVMDRGYNDYGLFGRWTSVTPIEQLTLEFGLIGQLADPRPQPRVSPHNPHNPRALNAPAHPVVCFGQQWS